MACRTKASRQRVRVLERWKARGLPSGTCVHSSPLTLTVKRSLAVRRSLMGDRRHIKAWRPNGLIPRRASGAPLLNRWSGW